MPKPKVVISLFNFHCHVLYINITDVHRVEYRGLPVGVKVHFYAFIRYNSPQKNGGSKNCREDTPSPPTLCTCMIKIVQKYKRSRSHPWTFRQDWPDHRLGRLYHPTQQEVIYYHDRSMRLLAGIFGLNTIKRVLLGLSNREYKQQTNSLLAYPTFAILCCQ